MAFIRKNPFLQIVVWTTTSCARNGQLRGNVKLIKPIWTRTVLIPVIPAKHAPVSLKIFHWSERVRYFIFKMPVITYISKISVKQVKDLLY